MGEYRLLPDEPFIYPAPEKKEEVKAEGNCPRCGAQIGIMLAGTDIIFPCPECGARLAYKSESHTIEMKN